MTVLNPRSKHILSLIIDSYIKTGEPVGSKTLAGSGALDLSPASIRNVMSDLEQRGYLYSPHTSAGRMPTDAGLTVFVEGMLEVNHLSKKEQAAIRAGFDSQKSKPVNDKLEHTSRLISGLSSCAGLVIAPKVDRQLKEIELLKLSDNRILAVLVYTNGQVENRVIQMDDDVPPASLRTAANYLNDFLSGQKLSNAQKILQEHIRADQAQLDRLTQSLINAGIAVLSPQNQDQNLIIRGQAHLLENINVAEDLERLQQLFIALEEKDTLNNILSAVDNAKGVQIYIGSDNSLFEHSGCSLIISPYKNEEKKVIGAVGVIGPTRLNYRRVIPVINYTSELISDYL